MSEREPEPKKTRIEELISKMDLQQQQTFNELKAAKPSFPIYEAKDIFPIIDKFTTLERQKNDTLWMTRLLKSGVPSDEVVDIYNLKEEDRHVHDLEMRLQDDVPEKNTVPQKRKTFKDIIRFKRTK